MSSDNKELIQLTGIDQTKAWFEQAIPNPTIEQACVQVGCGLEETSELAKTLNCPELSRNLANYANSYKTKNEYAINELTLLSKEDAQQMLDDIVDEIVTRVGIAHMMGFDIAGALTEVNRSNFSKFENGKPVFDEQGKITKGKNYTPPDLTPYI